MTNFPRSRLIPEYGDPNDPAIRAKYGYLEGIVSIIGNTVLFLLKLILGIFINSIALIADSVHSISDTGTSGVVILGFKMAKKPPDKEHPFGHGRVEYIATIIIAVLLIIVGFGFIEQSIQRIMNPEKLANGEYGILIGIIIIISALIKEFLAQFSFKIGKKIKSEVLIADAWHHRSDAISSIFVALGIIGSIYGYPLLDPIFGIVVSIIIIYVGIDLVKKASNILIGTGPDREIVENVRKILRPINGIESLDEIFIHDYGPSKVISLQVSVENDLKLDKAHAIADKIEKKIKDILNYSTIIHLEPKETHDNVSSTKRLIENILKKQDKIISFHKLQIIRHGKTDNFRMHIIVNKDMSVEESHRLCHNLENIIKAEYGDCKVDIHLEPCGEDCEICKYICKK